MKNELKKRIMSRIYFEYCKGVLWNNFQYILAVVFLLIFIASVSLYSIFVNVSNMPVHSLFNFIVVTLKDTEIITLIIFVSAVLFLITSGLKIFKTNFHISRLNGIAEV